MGSLIKTKAKKVVNTILSFPRKKKNLLGYKNKMIKRYMGK